MTTPLGYRPIGEYAIIGDCRSAALVSRDGSLDWLCWPRFDSPSVFAALLDHDRGGHFSIRPSGSFDVERHYLPDTNVLETIFRTSTGAVALRDLMPVASEADKHALLLPEHEILRELYGLDGQVDLEVSYEPRPDYGQGGVTLRQRGPCGLFCETGRSVLMLQSDIPLRISSFGDRAQGTVRLHAGECRHLSLGFSEEAPAVFPSLGSAAETRVARSIRWWQQWAAQCTYRGPYREEVVRSLLTLKLMTYAPSGAIVAAPTSSLPEKLGGVRNWDYRYCWLRDASFTVRALFALGYEDEARAFLSWMLHATCLSWPELQVVYDIFGKTELKERELPHLEGYAQSRPVRIGNGAHHQLQLDVYGEVLDAAAHFVSHRQGRFDRDTVRMLNGLGHTVCKRWSEPDEGIWEGRSGRFHHTHSKVLCWVALDRLIQIHDEGHPEISVEHFQEVRDAIRVEIEARGCNQELGSYVQIFDGQLMDASLLLLPWYGYVDARDPRMLSTYARLQDRLGKNGLLFRYESETDDGLPTGEGAFGICSFWAVECLARGGQVDAASRDFEALLGRANDVGLYAEEIDPVSGEQLGNFPQAFTHLGLINAALTLAECRGESVGQQALAPVEPTHLEVAS